MTNPPNLRKQEARRGCPRTWNTRYRVSEAAAAFKPGFRFGAQKWCPEAATFASASLLPPPTEPLFPSPTGGAAAASRSLGPGRETRRRLSDEAARGSHPKPSPSEALLLRVPVLASPGAWELLRSRSRSPSRPPPHLQQTRAPPVPSGTSVHRTRAGHLPSRAAFHPAPERKGSASFTHTRRRGSRQEQCLFAATLRLQGSLPGRLPRAGRASVPFRPRSDLPPGPAHTSNQQRRGDVARGHQGSRRGPAAADSSRSPPPPSDEPQASAAGEPRARFPYNHLFTGARRCGERLGTRTSRPLCRRPLLLFYPCRQGRGTPQHGAGQSRISSTPGAQPSRVSSGARAVRRRAHVRSRPERRGTGTGLRPRRGR
ncbi:putative uncharacterized protein ENSP00000383309 isoform X3 [Canis lupus familiaris]|uniref:putative uncharacterized protein ENSP00000383309 isoform X3 n=2 Tax=Canis lupus familiaris TaxID=9615 RepID=UPI0018F63459|nr:putative uncharacterized protein ENSP00000383309 isoform X3 [Canis lupus familiaris]